MPQRSNSQKIGSHAHQCVRLIASRYADWIVRSLDEDFGIDLELELVQRGGRVDGQFIKVQVKGTTNVPKRNSHHIVFRAPKALFDYAITCRLPVILVVVDTHTEAAWYVWLQEWVTEFQRTGGDTSSLPKKVTLKIPLAQTLDKGLAGELKNIALWNTATQLVIGLRDCFRSAIAIGSHDIASSLFRAVPAAEHFFDRFPVELLLEQILVLGNRLWGTKEGNDLSTLLFALCRSYGNRLSADHIYKIVVRGESVSRIGVNALGLVYEHFPEHAKKLRLPHMFREHPDQRLVYFCKLREAFLGESLLGIFQKRPNLKVGSWSLLKDAQDDFLDKWANRGDSIVFDYVQRERRTRSRR